MSKIFDYHRSNEFYNKYNVTNFNNYLHIITGPLFYMFILGILHNFSFFIPLLLQVGFLVKLSYMFSDEEYKFMSIVCNVLYIKTVFFNYSFVYNILSLTTIISAHVWGYKDIDGGVFNYLEDYGKYLLVLPIISLEKIQGYIRDRHTTEATEDRVN